MVEAAFDLAGVPAPSDKGVGAVPDDMPVSGYDPEDLDDALAERMEAEGRDPSEWLTDEELREWEDGASLVDLLDEEDIHELLGDDETAGGGDEAGEGSDETTGEADDAAS